MASGISINKRAIAKMSRDIEKEFAKNPVKVPLTMDIPSNPTFGPGDTYNGPVVQINGDSAQVALNSNNVTQTNSSTRQEVVASGFEPIAAAVGKVLEGISQSGLDSDQVAEVEETGRLVLEEVTKENPDKSLLKRSLTMLRGLLAPIAVGAQEGAADAVQESANNWAATGIKALITAAAVLA